MCAVSDVLDWSSIGKFALESVISVQSDLQSDYVRSTFSILRILGFKGY